MAWAKSLRGQLANSRLITWKGDGHTAYFRGSGCVDSITNAYLLERHGPRRPTGPVPAAESPLATLSRHANAALAQLVERFTRNE